MILKTHSILYGMAPTHRNGLGLKLQAVLADYSPPLGMGKPTLKLGFHLQVCDNATSFHTVGKDRHV